MLFPTMEHSREKLVVTIDLKCELTPIRTVHVTLTCLAARGNVMSMSSSLPAGEHVTLVEKSSGSIKPNRVLSSSSSDF